MHFFVNNFKWKQEIVLEVFLMMLKRNRALLYKYLIEECTISEIVLNVTTKIRN